MTTHDYTHRRWGHDFSITRVHDDGMRLDMMGWGEGIRRGDYLILPNGESDTRYRVDDVSYMVDPIDMWRIRASFAPREEED